MHSSFWLRLSIAHHARHDFIVRGNVTYVMYMYVVPRVNNGGGEESVELRILA